MERPTLLVVDDDHEFVEAARTYAGLCQFEATGAHSLSGARRALARGAYDLVLMDVALPDGSGLDLIEQFRQSGSTVAVVTGSAPAQTGTASLPATDYLLKPLSGSRLETLLTDAYERWYLRTGGGAGRPPGFIGDSPAMKWVYHQIRRVAPTDATVLFVGESGTGKEVAARAVHESSGRGGPFVAVNCGAVAHELLASHLFGHERGSFTGAVRQHKGHFEQAEGGTLFLDEITEMPPSLQAHLLRVLETRRITRVGGYGEVAVDVRVVAATNRDPDKAIAAGILREDLYFRLGEFCLSLPPLRERGNDVLQIAQAVLHQLNERYGESKQLDEVCWHSLQNHAWPGNVRELRNLVHRAYIMSSGRKVRVICSPYQPVPAADASLVSFRVGTPLEVVEREMLLRTLKHFRGDKSRTAQALGISVKTVYNHLTRHQDAGMEQLDPA